MRFGEKGRGRRKDGKREGERDRKRERKTRNLI